MKTVEKISETPIPKLLRKKCFGVYAKVYKVKQEDMVLPLEAYPTFSAFFTRQVKPRLFENSAKMFISPSDSKLLRIG